MSISLQTNVDSLMAQDNLRMNSDFQSRTIERLTSGYRIDSPADDAAGLAVANKFRSDTAELTQGIRNANDGVSQLQIVDGGLNSISKILDRMKTLATQAASSTFTGDRNILNNEFKSLVGEIDRQSNNIQLNSGGKLNANLSVYIGSAAATGRANATVGVNLSGTANAVDSTSLGVNGASVAGGGNVVSAGGKDLTLAANATLLTGVTNQTFTLNYIDGTGAAQTATITAHAKANGVSVACALSVINRQLSRYGITASLSRAEATNGQLQFSSGEAFSITSTAATTDSFTTNAVLATVDNSSLYSVAGTGVVTTDNVGESLQFNAGGQTSTVTFVSNTTAAAKVLAINTMTAALGITAVVNGAGKITLESQSAFTVVNLVNGTTSANNVIGGATLGNIAVTPPAAGTSATGSATSAWTSIAQAVRSLGTVQGVVGAGQNQLQYAITRAQSQISNFSAAESRIRDAGVAAEAVNLTKAQVLQQASIAAMAQATSAPEAVLRLLQ